MPLDAKCWRREVDNFGSLGGALQGRAARAEAIDAWIVSVARPSRLCSKPEPRGRQALRSDIIELVGRDDQWDTGVVPNEVF